MSNKRTIDLTSPDYTDNKTCIKKRLYCNNNMSTVNQNSTQDVFSWEKLCYLLDDKLKDVTRKADLIDLKAEIDELKKENMQLKNDLKKVSTRLEFIDRKSRSSNVVVSGLSNSNVNGAKSEFVKLCTEVLKTNVNIISTRMISSGKAVCFTLESSTQAYNVTSAKNKLKGRSVYIQKDYTEEEQNVRYNLRQISKKISKSNSNVKVRLGEFCIYLNNKKYIWSKGKVLANSEMDAQFLNGLLAQCNYPMDVCVREAHNNRTTTSETLPQ